MSQQYALYVSSFPPQRYRRPLLASKALKLLGIKTLFYSGWSLVDRHKALKTLVHISSKLPKPLDWLLKDAAYESGLYLGSRVGELRCIINLDTVGAYSLRKVAGNSPLIIDLQEITIQDDGRIPFYDSQMLKMADAVIFTSRAIKELVNQQVKPTWKSFYVPFGIDLQSFDKAYNSATAEQFLKKYNLIKKPLICYSGAAYLWGDREGQGLELLIKSAAKIVKQINDVKVVIQGAAQPNTYMWAWLQTRIKRNNLEGQVLLMPPTNPFDPVRLGMFKASDVLMLPIGDILGTYYSEQQKLFEYMAARRPIAMVATPARLHVLDERCAFIARHRDPDEFADIITEALENPGQAAEKASRARKIVEEKYDWKILIHSYAAAIASTIGA
ncbi:MAG: glycosyltransferase [Candidatus Caldarchaeum sp.]